MLKLLQMLEPRFDFKGTIIYQELEHPSEAIFLEKGRVDIGFAINKKSIYVVGIEKGGLIGAFNMIFNMKINYNYICKTNIEGYFIRK